MPKRECRIYKMSSRRVLGDKMWMKNLENVPETRPRCQNVKVEMRKCPRDRFSMPKCESRNEKMSTRWVLDAKT